MGQEKAFHPNAYPRVDRRYHRTLRMPLVEICGRKRVLIENHLGVIGYDSEEIIVKVCLGAVYILGTQLKVAMICKEKMVITGSIDAVRFQGRE